MVVRPLYDLGLSDLRLSVHKSPSTRHFLGKSVKFTERTSCYNLHIGALQPDKIKKRIVVMPVGRL